MQYQTKEQIRTPSNSQQTHRNGWLRCAAETINPHPKRKGSAASVSGYAEAREKHPQSERPGRAIVTRVGLRQLVCVYWRNIKESLGNTLHLIVLPHWQQQANTQTHNEGVIPMNNPKP